MSLAQVVQRHHPERRDRDRPREHAPRAQHVEHVDALGDQPADEHERAGHADVEADQNQRENVRAGEDRDPDRDHDGPGHQADERVGEAEHRALPRCGRSVEIEPENGAYLDSLGWYYFKKGDAERALKELLRAQENILREEKKDDPTVLDHIADAYSKLGKTPEALTYWQKALALQPEDKKLAGRITEKLETAKQKLTSGAPVLEQPKQ